MGVLTIMCSRTGDYVSAGIEIEPDEFGALPATLSRMRCPACGSEHVWHKGSAWVTEGAAALALPALKPSVPPGRDKHPFDRVQPLLDVEDIV
jgi:hypothetical protein